MQLELRRNSYAVFWVAFISLVSLGTNDSGFGRRVTARPCAKAVLLYATKGPVGMPHVGTFGRLRTLVPATAFHAKLLRPDVGDERAHGWQTNTNDPDRGFYCRPDEAICNNDYEDN